MPFLPTKNHPTKIVKAADDRWIIEACFEIVKSEVGLDLYEERNFTIGIDRLL